MAVDRVTLNHAALGAILKGAAVEGRLLAIGERVKADAASRGVEVQRGNDREPMPYEVRSVPSKSRARVYVVANHPAGLSAEAKYGTLTAALDSA